jgi:hypothetical protein
LRGASGFQTREVGVDLPELRAISACRCGWPGACHQVSSIVRWAKQWRIHLPTTPRFTRSARAQVLDAVTAWLNAALRNLTALALEQVGDAARWSLAGTVAAQNSAIWPSTTVRDAALEHQDHVVAITSMQVAFHENGVLGGGGCGAHAVFPSEPWARRGTPVLTMAAGRPAETAR